MVIMQQNDISELDPQLAEKCSRLLAILADMPRAIIAFSGGVDSATLAKAAALALGDQAQAITADSPSVPRREIESAIAIAHSIGIRHQLLPTHEFDSADYIRNDGTRCYHCKSELYDTIFQHLGSKESAVVCSGANVDDLGDYRPGLRAAAERQIRHPLVEAELNKQEVRKLARHWQLAVWDKPAAPCLSSRLAPGLAVTVERTRRVEDAESFLHALGLRECRVRYHEGDLARIEVPLSELTQLIGEPVRASLSEHFHQLGFRYITLDIDGFRSGSLNELVPLTVKTNFSQNPQTAHPVLP